MNISLIYPLSLPSLLTKLDMQPTNCTLVYNEPQMEQFGLCVNFASIALYLLQFSKKNYHH